MRIRRLTARAFGPFHEQGFDFGPGMNVIAGPNEAGKSSLHAAVYAGLCGMRRGRGGKRAADREFEEKHRPWRGEAWSVEIELVLDGGRRIQIVQDLAGQVESRALDLETNRDITSELLHDGMPDGALLLGLNREILPGTIFIGQGDVLRVLQNADELQEQLQRAAAAGGAGEPAEAAIQRIGDFQREQVGQLRAGGKRPHQLAIQSLAHAKQQLDKARAAYASYLETVERRNRAEVESRETEGRLAAIEQAVARRRADRHRRRVKRARAMSTRLPATPPPEMKHELDQLAEARAALAAFDARPSTPSAAGGRSVGEIEQELSGLPKAATPQETAHRKKAKPRRARRWHLPLGLVTVFAGLALAVLTTGLPRIGGLVAIAAGLALVARGLAKPVEREPEELEELREEFRAGRREQLTAELAARRAVEEAVEEAGGLRAAAEARVRNAAGAAGIDGVAIEETVRGLRELVDRTEEEIARGAREREEWAVLQELLGGDSLDKLEAELERLEQEAAGFTPTDDLPREVNDLEQLLDETRTLRDGQRRELHRLNGQVEVLERELVDVVAAEESHEQARRELARVERLKETLERTLEFLGRARDRIQRDVAPILRASVEDHLAGVTGGRYTEALVDPADLRIRVRGAGGDWTEASRLSHGTQEQIYLLLRLGLADHLVTTGESAPLLLDDPTVQCDAERTIALLELLHRTSRERQILLFSQEREVQEWAGGRFGGGDDRLLQLEPIPLTYSKPT